MVDLSKLSMEELKKLIADASVQVTAKLDKEEAKIPHNEVKKLRAEYEKYRDQSLTITVKAPMEVYVQFTADDMSDGCINVDLDYDARVDDETILEDERIIAAKKRIEKEQKAFHAKVKNLADKCGVSENLIWGILEEE